MTDGYQAVLADLQEMASTFTREADDYRQLEPRVSPPPASSGDGRLDATIHAVMATLGSLHDRMATMIEDHGNKLREAHDTYQRRDIDNRELFEDLVPKTWGW